MASVLGILGSQEIYTSGWLADEKDFTMETPFGWVKGKRGFLGGTDTITLTRNGTGKPLASHAINHKANISAFAQAGVERVVGTAMGGSLRHTIPVGGLALLDQFIDATKRTQFTFFDEENFAFADMTEPYCVDLRHRMLASADRNRIHVNAPAACYVCTDGPRFETSAEVRMYGLLGGDVIGMTGIPECVMAREAGICYASIAGILNMGAGMSDRLLNAYDWRDLRQTHAEKFRSIMEAVAADLQENPSTDGSCACAQAAPIEK